MARLTKDEWEVIINAVAYYETVLFDDEYWPNVYTKDDETSAKSKFIALRKKIWSKTNGN